jgi:hypothetical protein
MINFIQLNQNVKNWDVNIITNITLEELHTLLYNDIDNTTEIITFLHDISIQYNTDKKTIIKMYFNYIIREKKELVTPKILNIIDTIMHCTEENIEHILIYFTFHLKCYYNEK